MNMIPGLYCYLSRTLHKPFRLRANTGNGMAVQHPMPTYDSGHLGALSLGTAHGPFHRTQSRNQRATLPLDPP